MSSERSEKDKLLSQEARTRIAAILDAAPKSVLQLALVYAAGSLVEATMQEVETRVPFPEGADRELMYDHLQIDTLLQILKAATADVKADVLAAMLSGPPAGEA